MSTNRARIMRLLQLQGAVITDFIGALTVLPTELNLAKLNPTVFNRYLTVYKYLFALKLACLAVKPD